jgi:hypothetical protein
MATSLIIASALLIPMLVFGGFFVAPGTIPVYLNWFKYLSPFYYTFPVLFTNGMFVNTIECLMMFFVCFTQSIICLVLEMVGLSFYCAPNQFIVVSNLTQIHIHCYSQ